MDLKKLSNEQKLTLCRKYFLGGCAFLPFMWLINSIWFFSEAFRRPQYDEQKKIRRFVIFSMIGTLTWITVIVAWVTVFQLYRSSWGATADYMSFIIPRGEL